MSSSSIQVKDANANTVTVATLPALGATTASNSLPVVLATDQPTVAVEITNQLGSTGTDFSANQPTLPTVGNGFGSAGPYANYVLILTVPANPNRLNVDIENISGAQIAVIRDDGTAATHSPPLHASVFALVGTSVGAQGGSWSSTTFKGRLQIYALSSSAIVTVMVD